MRCLDCGQDPDAEQELFELCEAVRAHRDQRGDDRCWQDDETLYKALPEGYTPPERDTTVELENCKRYIACRQNPHIAYESPQREIERLEAEVEFYKSVIVEQLDIILRHVKHNI